MGEQILESLIKRLEGVVGVVVKDLATVRTGRAKPSLVESVRVDAYGSSMELRELANIATSDSTLIVVTPWDASLTDAVMKGIRDANLGLNPMLDGQAVKIPIPALTQERREELVRLVAQKVESGKVMVRQVRTEIKEEIEVLKGQSGVSEDDIRRWLEQMQRSVDDYTAKVEQSGRDKEKDLLTI